jgi:carbon monoxide dehydrogenase subunit G
MQLKDSLVVHAPVQAVWAFIFDLQRAAPCIPGAEDVEAVDDRTYRGRLRLQVGAITTRFEGRATLLEQDPPQRLVALIEADDQVTASQVKATFTANLAPEAEDTRLSYLIDFQLRGRLAQFGFAVMQGIARRYAAEFTRCLQASLAAAEEQ